MKPEEGNTGVEKEAAQEEIIENLYQKLSALEMADNIMLKDLREQNAELRQSLSDLQLAFNIMENPGSRMRKLEQSLSELIPIAEKFISSNYSHPDRVPEQYKSAIERAKLLNNGHHDKD